MKISQKALAHIAMLLFAAIISGSFSFGAMAAPFMSASALNAIRFVLACLIMLALGLALYRRAPFVTAGAWRFAVLGGLSAVYFITMFVALKIASPVSTSAVFTLVPLMSTGFGWLLSRQTVGINILIGLVLAATGALWVIFSGDLDALLGFEIGRGELIFLVGCIAYAAYAPMVRKLNRGEDAFRFSFMTLLGCTVLTIAYGFFDLVAINWAAVPAIVWLAIGYLAIFSTAISFFLLQFASLRLPASKVLSYGYLIPVFVILYEGLLGHGWASLSVVAGGLVAVLALGYALTTRDESNNAAV